MSILLPTFPQKQLPKYEDKLTLKPVVTPVNLHANILVSLGHSFLHHWIKRPQKEVSPDEHVDLNPDRIQHAGDLNSNVSRSNNGDFAWQDFDVKKTFVRDAKFGTCDIFWYDRIPATSDTDVFRRVPSSATATSVSPRYLNSHSDFLSRSSAPVYLLAMTVS